MVGPVAVGVDDSSESLAAVEWAAGEAASRGSPLRIVCAQGSRADSRHFSSGTSAQEQAGWPQEQILEARRLAAGVAPSLEITELVVEEAPVPALLQEAGQSDMLVLGSRGLGAVSGFVVGSVSLSVIAHAASPVVAVRSRESPGAPETDPVVVGLDLAHRCEPLLEFAFGAASHRGVTLRVAHAWSARSLYSYPSALPDPGVVRKVGAEAKAQLEGVLAPWRRRFRDVRVEEWNVEAAVVPLLLQASAGAGLLVVGRRTRGHPYPTRIGPVTHAALHHAAPPVVVVPHE